MLSGTGAEEAEPFMVAKVFAPESAAASSAAMLTLSGSMRQLGLPVPKPIRRRKCCFG